MTRDLGQSTNPQLNTQDVEDQDKVLSKMRNDWKTLLQHQSKLLYKQLRHEALTFVFLQFSNTILECKSATTKQTLTGYNLVTEKA